MEPKIVDPLEFGLEWALENSSPQGRTVYFNPCDERRVVALDPYEWGQLWQLLPPEKRYAPLTGVADLCETAGWTPISLERVVLVSLSADTVDLSFHDWATAKGFIREDQNA